MISNTFKKFSLAIITVLFLGQFVFAESSRNVTVKVVTNEIGINDKSFNASIWKGILRFYGEHLKNQKNLGILYDNAIYDGEENPYVFLSRLCEENNSLIILPGYTFDSVMEKVTKDYPLQKFAVIDADSVESENIMSFEFREEEGSYLAGALAALQSIEDKIENPVFGFIGGISNPVITRFEMGYIQGIKAVLPNAKICDYYVESWTKPVDAKKRAKEWFDNDVYTVFSAAGFSTTGVILAAKEARLKGKNVWAIGIDSDQFAEGIYSGTKSAVLTSMIKHSDIASFMALESMAKNTFDGSSVRLSLKDGALNYSKKNTVIKSSVYSKVERFKQDIISGKIKVYSTYDETLKAGIAPSGLGAKDK